MYFSAVARKEEAMYMLAQSMLEMVHCSEISLAI